MTKLPPNEILIDALIDSIEITWKNTFEQMYTDEKRNFAVDWIESIKYKKLDQTLITKMLKRKPSS